MYEQSNITKKEKGKLMFCNRCGRILYEYANNKSRRMGCKTTWCPNHLPYSQNLSNEEIRAVRR